MIRRDFATAAAGTAALALTSIGSHADHRPDGIRGRAVMPELGAGFQMKYAPHEGLFRHHAGHDYLAQLRFAAEVGFTAWEDNGMLGRPIEQQEKAAGVMAERGITMGTFIGYASFTQPAFADPDDQSRQALKARMAHIIEGARRVGGKWTTIIPGTFVHHVEWDRQTANVVDTLKRCAEILEPEGIVMLLEPQQPGAGRSRCFLSRVSQAYRICELVGSPSCKILSDLYPQQVREGNLLPNLDKAWSEIAYVQVGDHPGRMVPGSGEINYRNIFRHLHERGFEGVIGMEHGISRSGKKGEFDLIRAYRDADRLLTNKTISKT